MYGASFFKYVTLNHNHSSTSFLYLCCRRSVRCLLQLACANRLWTPTWSATSPKLPSIRVSIWTRWEVERKTLAPQFLSNAEWFTVSEPPAVLPLPTYAWVIFSSGVWMLISKSLDSSSVNVGPGKWERHLKNQGWSCLTGRFSLKDVKSVLYWRSPLLKEYVIRSPSFLP